MAVVVVLTFSCNNSSDISYSGLLLWKYIFIESLKRFSIRILISVMPMCHTVLDCKYGIRVCSSLA